MSGDGPIRVLIADDSPVLRDTVADLIGTVPDFELVGTAATAEEAIRRVEQTSPDVVLVDVRMPGGGASATREIKDVSPETQIVVLSGHDDRPTVLEMLEAGAIAYLVKGVDADEITDAIRGAAEGRGRLSPRVAGDVIHELAGELHSRRSRADSQRAREQRIRQVLDEPSRLAIAFQPVFSLDGGVVGAEALARFAGPPHRGPDRWFAEADDVGLRVELELHAAGAALAALSLLDDVYLAVNLSPDIVASPAFGELVDGIDAHRIVVEITEHAPIDDTPLSRTRSSKDGRWGCDLPSTTWAPASPACATSCGSPRTSSSSTARSSTGSTTTARARRWRAG